MARLRGTPYQTTLRTTRERGRILDDLEALGVPGAAVSERGDTYLVFSPQETPVYGPGRATILAAAIALAVLIATAANVVWILLLPAALLAYAPLLIDDHPMLAVGAVDEEEPGVTRLTVHGHAWGELVPAIDAYLSHLPEAPAPLPEAPGGDEAGAAGEIAVGAARGGTDRG